MNNDKNKIPPTVQNLIDMFFAQKKLYERMTGVCVPSSITYTKKLFTQIKEQFNYKF